MKTLLLGTDGSAGARAATEAAIELARSTGWRLRVVAVWSLSPIQLSAAPILAGELAETACEHAELALEQAVAAAADAGVSAIPHLRHGDAADQILEVAGRLGDVIVVVGSHGRGALGRALLGSVSTKLVHAASCPVLVVRPGRPVPAADERTALASSA